MSTLRLANIGDIEIDCDDVDLKPGDRIEIRGTVDVIRGNLVEVTALGMNEPKLIPGKRTATVFVTKIDRIRTTDPPPPPVILPPDTETRGG